MREDECKGCVDYDKNCLISGRVDCPCSLCLIKGICTDTCEAFDERVKDIKYKTGGYYNDGT